MKEKYYELFLILEVWTTLGTDDAVAHLNIRETDEYLDEALRQWTFMTIEHRAEVIAIVEEQYGANMDAREYIDQALTFGQQVSDFRRRIRLRKGIPVM